jgi:hypothetical protein
VSNFYKDIAKNGAACFTTLRDAITDRQVVCDEQASRIESLTRDLAAAREQIAAANATVERCKQAGFVDDGGRPIHIPKHSKPSRADVANMHDYIEWHGPQHLHGCPEDDTCDCGGRPINESVNKCLLFLKHFTGGQPITAAEAAREGKGGACSEQA